MISLAALVALAIALVAVSGIVLNWRDQQQSPAFRKNPSQALTGLVVLVCTAGAACILATALAYGVGAYFYQSGPLFAWWFIVIINVFLAIRILRNVFVGFIWRKR